MVSGYPISTNLPRVDGLLTDPRDLGCHTWFLLMMDILFSIGLAFKTLEKMILTIFFIFLNWRSYDINLWKK